MLDFDQLEGHIWMDGQIIDWQAAKLHVLTHSLHYGSAVFEGERAYNGKIYKLEEHSQRLCDSAKLVGYNIPWNVEQINDATIDILKKSKLKNAYIRPIAWRGSQEMGLAARKNKVHLAIACWEWPSYFTFEQRMQGLRLNIAQWKRPSPKTAPVHSKMSGLYPITTMAKHLAEDQGFDDALFLDYRDLIAESTGANIFFVIDGALHTPQPDCFLNGITRQSVIAIAKQNDITVIERHIKLEELTHASEAFLTGTAVEITPVKQIGNYHFQPGDLSHKLMQAYEQDTQC